MAIHPVRCIARRSPDAHVPRGRLTTRVAALAGARSLLLGTAGAWPAPPRPTAASLPSSCSNTERSNRLTGLLAVCTGPKANDDGSGDGGSNSHRSAAAARGSQPQQRSVGSGMNVLHHRSALASPEVGATPKLTVPHRFSQRFSSASDCRRKIRGTETCFVSRPPLSRLRRRFAPLRGALRRCAALRAAVSTALRAGALRARLF